MRQKILIYGISEFAQNVAYYFENYSKSDIAAFTIESEFYQSSQINGIPVVEFEKIEETYPRSQYKLFVAIGYSKMNNVRKKIYLESKNRGYSFVTFIHPSCAIDKSVQIGDNCFLFENSTLQKGVTIGDNVLIWSGVTICHDVKIADHCFLASESCINGCAEIKENCFLGANCTIRNNVVVEKETLVGAGTTILKNTKEKEVYKIGEPVLLKISSDKINNF